MIVRARTRGAEVELIVEQRESPPVTILVEFMVPEYRGAEDRPTYVAVLRQGVYTAPLRRLVERIAKEHGAWDRQGPAEWLDLGAFEPR